MTKHDIACSIVKRYIDEHLDKTTPPVDPKLKEPYVVWACHILQNEKFLISTDLPDGKYYEVTYNGDKDEWYLDTYVKIENVCYTGEGLLDPNVKPKKTLKAYAQLANVSYGATGEYSNQYANPKVVTINTNKLLQECGEVLAKGFDDGLHCLNKK